MHSVFDESPEFELDALRTADEIQRCGQNLLHWLEELAESPEPALPDVHLICSIHRAWFETTFPADAGHERTAMVLNRKGTSAAKEAILPAIDNACGNWTWRRQHVAPTEGPELVEFIVAEANTLAVAVYDTHPFIDGNTRTTWHLRNYTLMLDGLRPLTELVNEDAHDQAWWAATPQDHEDLDRIVLDELAAHDR